MQITQWVVFFYVICDKHVLNITLRYGIIV